MTDEEEFDVSDTYLCEIQDRLNAATPGPWRHRDQFIETETEPEQLLGVTMQRNEQGLEFLPGGENARFIAHARTDLPRLVAEVQRLKSKLVDLQRQISPPHE